MSRVGSRRYPDRPAADMDYLKYIKSSKWAWMRQVALAIHGERCSRCGTTEGPLQVHHLHYKTTGNEDARRDLRIVCRRCHRIEHGLDPDGPDQEPKDDLATVLLEGQAKVMAEAVRRMRMIEAREARRRARRKQQGPTVNPAPSRYFPNQPNR